MFHHLCFSGPFPLSLQSSFLSLFLSTNTPLVLTLCQALLDAGDLVVNNTDTALPPPSLQGIINDYCHLSTIMASAKKKEGTGL